ncbi:hypothetical protein UREG_00762 [Uncinocarpus reesii 1704]|uniref:W2 domain-containing protein n=1 Tax=Uncinocarpus reesii (strain UAMH 1704) TaxID=336963 RepID=C4JDI6_UNCRE|nr:uncharacterized protein UREG_00762 [Uncinocarpus reesii 1704]EEP75915.1 hypothetical protein UREG_00762 [Uncinocarpus reesii 1704]
MATVNIRRDVSDPFYRYKMERLQAKIEGKGNGIKTVVVNLNSVAQALGRPPAYLIKYFGFELGAQANPKPTDDRWIINGAHDAGKLQDYLDGFISRFVLCKKCKNPETTVVIKDTRILLDCKACGERSEVDGRLKLSGFVLKNQPKKGKKDKSTKKTRRERNKEKAENGENGETNGSPGDSPSEGDENGDVEVGAHSDDEFTRRINAEAKEIEQDDEIDDDQWAVDVSEEAVKARAKELPDDLKRSLITSERHMKALLGGTERFVGKERPELIPQVPAILLAYYQEDLVSEEVLKSWGSKASKKYVDLPTSKKVRKAAEKFLEWLETAESEDESEDEE